MQHTSNSIPIAESQNLRKCHLLALPAELRIEIYSHVLWPSSQHTNSSNSTSKDVCIHDIAHACPYPKHSSSAFAFSVLFSLSRQVRHEACSLFFSESSFRFHGSGMRLRKWLKVLGYEDIGMLGRVESWAVFESRQEAERQLEVVRAEVGWLGDAVVGCRYWEDEVVKVLTAKHLCEES